MILPKKFRMPGSVKRRRRLAGNRQRQTIPSTSPAVHVEALHTAFTMAKTRFHTRPRACHAASP